MLPTKIRDEPPEEGCCFRVQQTLNSEVPLRERSQLYRVTREKNPKEG